MGESALGVTVTAEGIAKPEIETCDRCGNFTQAPKVLLGRRACEDCLAIPGADFLQAFKDEVWGRRDSFVTIAGVSLYSQILGIIGALVELTKGGPGFNYCFLASLLVGVANTIAYIRRVPRARLNFIYLSLIIPVFNVALILVLEGTVSAGMLAGFSALAILGFFVSLAGYQNTRNKLAFKIKVSEVDLEECYKELKDNPPARYGSGLGRLGLFLPILAPIGLILSIKGLRAVDPEAWPPVGNRRKALLGIVSSVVGLIWGTLALLRHALGS